MFFASVGHEPLHSLLVLQLSLLEPPLILVGLIEVGDVLLVVEHLVQLDMRPDRDRPALADPLSLHCCFQPLHSALVAVAEAGAGDVDVADPGGHVREQWQLVVAPLVPDTAQSRGVLDRVQLRYQAEKVFVEHDSVVGELEEGPEHPALALGIGRAGGRLGERPEDEAAEEGFDGGAPQRLVRRLLAQLLAEGSERSLSALAPLVEQLSQPREVGVCKACGVLVAVRVEARQHLPSWNVCEHEADLHVAHKEVQVERGCAREVVKCRTGVVIRNLCQHLPHLPAQLDSIMQRQVLLFQPLAVLFAVELQVLWPLRFVHLRKARVLWEAFLEALDDFLHLRVCPEEACLAVERVRHVIQARQQCACSILQDD
mmetsp:Transcript_22259/g.52616  ORF Transcript_22259/g.52616 Transcript_22259/m.52616 type:complete len:372 (-) Transcript_22259:256-1371(-)